MSNNTTGQEEILTETLLIRDEMRGGLGRLAALERRPETNGNICELGIANQAELKTLTREFGSLREEMRALKGRVGRFELEARRR
jgi:hypothetical protein